MLVLPEVFSFVISAKRDGGPREQERVYSQRKKHRERSGWSEEDRDDDKARPAAGDLRIAEVKPEGGNRVLVVLPESGASAVNSKSIKTVGGC